MANTYNTKNYAAHGGEEWVIGGKLTFLEGAEVENFPGEGGGGSYTLPTASAYTQLKEDFNALLAALRAAGLIEATAPETQETEGTEGGGT